MFYILDGRKNFYQWDKERKIVVGDNTITEVHFANCLCPNAHVCEVKEYEGGARVADVPNELLTEYLDIKVWGYDSGATKHEQIFEVEKRPKPADYVYTPTEVWTAEKAVEDALAEAKASGEFKGDKGDRGEPGAVKFIVVYELPATGEADAIYLLSTKDGTADNFYDEYIYVNGNWECIGSTSVDVNLDGYVKKTDYATYTEGGAVKVGAGLYITGDGALCLRNVRNDDLQDDEADNEAPLKAHNINDIVRNGLTKNTYTLSDTEKQKAQEWLGAVGNDDYATVETAGVVKVGAGLQALNGALQIQYAMPTQIEQKSGYRNPLSPQYIDLITKTGITTNTIELTEEEKQAALEWLGVSDIIADLTARIEALGG